GRPRAELQAKFLTGKLLAQTRPQRMSAVESASGSEAENICSARALPVMPSGPGEFHPEPLTEPDLTLSRHPARATARRLPPSIEHPGSSRCWLTRAKWR